MISELQITISEIEHGIREKNVILNSKNKEYVELVEKRAQAKRDWRMAYAKKIMELDDAITIRRQLVEGDKEVSKLEMKYEIALGIEKACWDSKKDLRLQIESYRTMLSWKKSEHFNPTI